jgi:hypothetical protein
MPVANYTPPPAIPGQPQNPLDGDRGFPSQLPVVPQVVQTTRDSAAPAWGFGSGHANVGDVLLPRNMPVACALDKVTVATMSPALRMGCRRYELTVLFSDPNGFCDINFYRVDAGGNTLVKSFARVTGLASGLFVGGQDLIDMDGRDFKVEVKNLSIGTDVTVNVAGH